MRKAVLFIAQSLDGLIAGPKGELDWLSIAEGDDYGYADFEKSFDTTILTGKTYRDVLKMGQPVYPVTTNYIYTRRATKSNSKNNIHFSGSVVSLLKRLKKKKGKDIFIVGGSAIIDPLAEANLIDEYRIFTLPIVLGNGKPLFGTIKKRILLSFIDSKSYPSGMVECRYRKKL